ncbi:MAG: ImmA/IrrE family metallo-endopeptidase [Planctomycetes bacterium]|nr:ImmA/IrrE family metallo-endopeptidase [Planctomycetota bacterium]
MPIDLNMLSVKLKRYREQFQTSLGELATATGIAEERLSSYESGRKEPTGDEILILADYYKCDFKFFIANERVAPFDQTETLFRLHGAELSKADRWAIQEFLFLCECEEFLMSSLAPDQRQPFTFIKKGNFFKGHGEEAASELRRHLGYGPNEIGMDLYADFRRIGLHVFRRQLENSNVSGLYVKHPTAGKCVLVNYTEDVYRQRFTAAHEAGHAILDDDQDVVVSYAKWKGSDYSEIRANTFASRYLMPPSFLQGIPDGSMWDAHKAVEWANKLKVSTEALSYALKDAKLVSQNAQKTIGSAKVPADDKVDPELPTSLAPKPRKQREELLRRGLSSSYVGLCFEAYERDTVSAGRLAEMLLVSESEVAEIGELYGRSLAYGD